MARRTGVVGLLIAAVALGHLALGGAQAAAAATVPRVMVVGDSVAHQFDGDYTWRYRLAMEFRRQQAPVDFVGPFRWGYGNAHRYLATGWDSDHDAQGATLLTDFMHLDPVPGAPNWGRFDLEDDMVTYRPDVLVMVMANNDVNNAMVLRTFASPVSIRDQYLDEGRTPAVEARVDLMVDDVLEDYQTLIASARSKNPAVSIVVAEVSSQLIEQWVRDEVNAAIATRLTSTPTSALVVAQTDDPRFAAPGFTVDGIHTTPTGDMLMAQRIAQGIHALPGSPLPAAPAIPQVTVSWNPVLVPRIKVAGRRIYLDWGVSARANTVLGVRVKTVNLRTKKVSYGNFWRKPNWNSSVLRPGKYRVRIQGIRGNMISTWSPVYTVTIAKKKVKKR